MKKYLVIKLASGSDVIGELAPPKTETSKKILLKHPMLIITTTLNTGSTVVILRSYALLAKNDQVSFDQNQIITSYEPEKIFIDYYNVMYEYNNKFINEDMLKGMKSAVALIDEVVKNGSADWPSSEKYEKSLEYWESLMKSDKKH